MKHIYEHIVTLGYDIQGTYKLRTWFLSENIVSRENN